MTDYTALAKCAIAKSAESKSRLATIRREARENVDRLRKSAEGLEVAGKQRAEVTRLVEYGIEGFFPTPRELSARMVSLASIEPIHRVLEPSAGAGHIADSIHEACPSCTLTLVEWNWSLCEALRRKGYNPEQEDFMEWQGGKFDRVIMNPPFERDQDIAHIRHAFDLLADGGRLVAIASAGILFRNGKRAEFRQWLEEQGADIEKLPEDTFRRSDRPTGVQTCLIVIDK